MRRLIVNADGFGFTFGNNRAILEVLEHGFIRSVSVNVTWPAVREVPTLRAHFPHVSIGVHLNLSVGPSILPADEIPTLVGSKGEFHGPDFPRLARSGVLSVEEMKKELRAQVRVLRELGVPITHWDSHQGRHLYPGFFEAALSVARGEGILATRTHCYYLIVPEGSRLWAQLRYYGDHPRQVMTHAAAAWRMRIARKAGMRMPDRRLVMAPLGADAVYRQDCWQRLLGSLPEGLNFIECHPGYIDEDLKKYSNWLEPRQRERELFSDPEWLSRAEAAGVQVVDYHVLAEPGK